MAANDCIVDPLCASINEKTTRIADDDIDIVEPLQKTLVGGRDDDILDILFGIFREILHKLGKRTVMGVTPRCAVVTADVEENESVG